MGLESVQLVMEVEDQFGLRLPDDELEHMHTAGQFHGLLCRRLLGRAPMVRRAVCASARAFYLLRRVLMERLDLPRHRIRPDALFAELIRPARREAWAQIAAGLRLDGAYSFNRATAVYFPSVLATVRDIVRRIPADDSDFADPAAQLIWIRLQKIISDQLGVRLSEIHPHTHFMRDLNMG